MKDKLLSLISLNIEKEKHLDLVRKFFVNSKPDVICLQEVFESDFVNLKKELAMEGLFCPMAIIERTYDRSFEKIGVAILSKLKIVSSDCKYYRGNKDILRYESGQSLDKRYKMIFAVLAKIKVVFDGKEFNIFSTHFTWTPDGLANDTQRKDVAQLLDILSKEKSFVLCGDFNAPRGGEIFAKIAEKYKDNIPPEYESSIDPDLHRKPGLRLMVDGLFSTPDYIAEHVKLVCGVSDHCAIKAKISLKN